MNLHLQALAVVGRRLAPSDHPDRVVRRNLTDRAAGMPWRPTVAEQKDQLARMLDRVAQVRCVEPEIGECPPRGGPAGFPVGISSELTDLFGASDARDRSRSAGFGRICSGCSGQDELHRKNRQISECHLDPHHRRGPQLAGMQA
jgi:hypothetical protein